MPVRSRVARVGDPTAWSVLRRVRAERGPASGQVCAECGAPAAVWSYDGADSDERIDRAARPDAGGDDHTGAGDGRGRRYSLDPARYRPRCRFCHRRAVVDRAAPVPAARRGAPSLDVDRAVRLYRAGASATGIAALLHVSPDAVLRALRARDVPIRPARPTPRIARPPFPGSTSTTPIY